MFIKTCFAVIFAVAFFAGSALATPFAVNNAFVCKTRGAVTKVVEYEKTILDGAEVEAADYEAKVAKIGCVTLFGAVIEKLEEVLRYTGVYPMLGTWVPTEVVVIHAKVRVLNGWKGVERFVFLPASTKFPGEVEF